MAQAKARIEQVAGDNANKIRFGNGESGWPTGMLPLRSYPVLLLG